MKASFVFVIPAFRCTVFIGMVLQVAFTGLVADRAIQGMVGKQHLEHALAGLAYLGGVGMDHHTLRHAGRAGGLQFADTLNFDEAHAAGRHRFETRM